MGRCGCSSAAASGVSVIDTDTIDVSGAGTPASPFAFNVEVSATAGNRLEAVGDGLLVPDQFEEFTSYTPAWSSDGGSQPSSPVLSEGSYLAVGPLLWVFVHFAASTPTSNFGSGNYTWSLPSPYASMLLRTVVFAANVFVNGVRMPASAQVTGSGIQVYTVDNDAAQYAMDRLSATFPAVPTTLTIEAGGVIPLDI